MGVLQGSIGKVWFILFINSLSSNLQATNLGSSIGPIHIAALGLVNDIVLVPLNPSKIQKLIEICKVRANAKKMEFNVTKCKVLTLNKIANTKNFFTLWGRSLDVLHTNIYELPQLQTNSPTSLPYILLTLLVRLQCMNLLLEAAASGRMVLDQKLRSGRINCLTGLLQTTIMLVPFVIKIPLRIDCLNGSVFHKLQ